LNHDAKIKIDGETKRKTSDDPRGFHVARLGFAQPWQE
jgi:hypothetical protein